MKKPMKKALLIPAAILEIAALILLLVLLFGNRESDLVFYAMIVCTGAACVLNLIHSIKSRKSGD